MQVASFAKGYLKKGCMTDIIARLLLTGFEGHGDCGKFLRFGRKQMSLQSSGRAGRRNYRLAGLSRAQLGGLNNPKPFQSI